MRLSFVFVAALLVSIILLSGCLDILFPSGLPGQGKPNPKNYEDAPSTASQPAGQPSQPPPTAPPSQLPNQSSLQNNTTETNGTPFNASAANQSGNVSVSILARNASGQNNTMLLLPSKNLSEYPLEIFFFNVGFGDATLLRQGNFTMLLDTGSEASAPSLISNLSTLGVWKIDVLALSGWDEGEAGGLQKIISSFPTSLIWHNNAPPPASQAFLGIEKSQIPQAYPERGKFYRFGPLELEIFNPAAEKSTGNPNLNSLAFRLSRSTFCAFFAGDIEQELEPPILGVMGSRTCAVMKMPNHGAGRSTPSVLLDRVSPKHAIISVGPNGQNLPANPTLERLYIRGSAVWRTDLSGTVYFAVLQNGTYSVTGSPKIEGIGKAYKSEFPPPPP